MLEYFKVYVACNKVRRVSMSRGVETSINSHLIGFSPIFIIIFLTIFSLWISDKIAAKPPASILGALQRIFGLLLGILAIEFVIQGVRQIFSI